MSEQKYWLGFNLVPEIGPVRLNQLKDHFGELAQAWHANERSLKHAGLDGTALENLLQKRQGIDLDAEMERVKQLGAVLVTRDDAAYPTLLKKIDDAPPVLYVFGRLMPQDNRALAIVGTRKATRYGRDVAFKLAKGLASQGITIVSGLVQGIDAAAHEGALEGGGRTIAVMGCGLDTIYPQENIGLARRIYRSGAIISEFAIGVPPSGKNFPRRNRIISGMSLGVLIAEAPEKSGALITANTALDQNREVFAAPSSIFNPMGHGGNRLIQEGAKLVMDVQDILEELNIQYEHVQTQQKTEAVVPTNAIEISLLEQISADPIHVDDLARMTGIPIEQITSTLAIMELKGLVQPAGQMQYCRAR